LESTNKNTSALTSASKEFDQALASAGGLPDGLVPVDQADLVTSAPLPVFVVFAKGNRWDIVFDIVEDEFGLCRSSLNGSVEDVELIGDAIWTINEWVRRSEL
jgi:hypothetical protein